MLPPFPSSEISPEASRKTDALSIHSVITFHCQVLQADYLAVCLIYCQASSPMQAPIQDPRTASADKAHPDCVKQWEEFKMISLPDFRFILGPIYEGGMNVMNMQQNKM